MRALKISKRDQATCLCREQLWGDRDPDGASLQRSIEHRAGAAGETRMAISQIHQPDSGLRNSNSDVTDVDSVDHPTAATKGADWRRGTLCTRFYGSVARDLPFVALSAIEWAECTSSKPTRMGTAKFGHSFDLPQGRWAGGYFNAINGIQSILIEFDRPGSSTLRSSTQAVFNLSTFFHSTLWQAPSLGPPQRSGDSGSSAGPLLIPGLCPEAWRSLITC